MNYQWPGNVRELINTVECAVAAGKNSSLLLPVHLPEYIRINVMKTELGGKPDKPFTTIPVLDQDLSYSIPLFRSYREKLVNEGESIYLRALVKKTDGSIEKASQISGLGKTRLYNLLKKHCLSKK